MLRAQAAAGVAVSSYGWARRRETGKSPRRPACAWAPGLKTQTPAIHCPALLGSDECVMSVHTHARPHTCARVHTQIHAFTYTHTRTCTHTRVWPKCYKSQQVCLINLTIYLQNADTNTQGSVTFAHTHVRSPGLTLQLQVRCDPAGEHTARPPAAECGCGTGGG